MAPAPAGRFLLRGIVYAAVFFSYFRAIPDHPHLAYESWLAGRIASGGIPRIAGAETYADPSAPWAAGGWLGAVIGASLQHAAGLAGYEFCSAAFVVASLIALEYVVRASGASDTLAACSILFVFPAFADLMRAGSPLTGFAGAPLFTAMAIRLEARNAMVYLGCVAAATALWCNATPYGLLALAITAGLLLSRRSRNAAIAACVALAACFATPGIGLFVGSALLELKLNAYLVHFNSDEFDRSPYPIATSVALPMAAIALAVFARSKRSAQQLIATLGAFLAVVVNALYLPVLAAVAAAIVFPEASRTRAGGTALGAVTVLIGVYAIALVVVAPRHSAATAPFEDESLLLSAARAHHAHRLVCTRVVWCDEGLEHGPAVYADDRFDAEPWQAYNDVFAMRYMLNGWPESMRRARPDAFIAGRDEPPVQILGTTPGWHTIVCTTTACLLMRATDS